MYSFSKDFSGERLLNVKKQIITLGLYMHAFEQSIIVCRADNRKIFIRGSSDRTCYGQQYLQLLLAINIIFITHCIVHHLWRILFAEYI